ncbi:MAG: hypothetical protein LBQ05_02365 [Christensenellaceae bacterium]|jgi:heat-inducible transcriptional repressor|nr:hypothetical protein [Christensenellaceae bacterium]
MIANKERRTMRELSKRLKELLLIGVKDYIKNLSPIASGSIAKKDEINRSSATVRNELKFLEELGYLRQLHTSGGRIPTVMGYKEFMESGIETTEVSSLSNIIIDLSNKIFEIKPDNIENIEILRVSITPLIDGNTIILTKTNAGSINSNIIADTPLTTVQADAISTAITGCLHGLNLEEIVCLGRIYTNPAPPDERLSLSWTASALIEERGRDRPPNKVVTGVEEQSRISVQSKNINPPNKVATGKVRQRNHPQAKPETGKRNTKKEVEWKKNPKMKQK